MIAGPMAHAIGSATISFGLVSIPVKLHTTSQTSENISFNLLHGKCGSRLKQQYVCASEGEVVERSEMVKGYEFAKGRYVVFTEDEIKAIEQKASEAIEIIEFVPASTIDPIFFEKAYYLSPSRGAERAYRLLSEAMRQTGRSALARYAARGRDHIVCLRPYGDAVVMQQLFYNDQIKPLAELQLSLPELKEQEVRMAVQLAEFGSADAFRPDEHRDESRARLRALIQKKVDGEEISVAPGVAERDGGEVIDLMAALRASLSQAATKKVASKARLHAAPEERKPARRATRPAATTKKVAQKKSR